MLAGLAWPDLRAFPVNHRGRRFIVSVWGDLRRSADPLVVAGFASIGKIVELAADIANRQSTPHLRVLLGTEPFSSQRTTFGSRQCVPSATRYAATGSSGISLLLSATIVFATQAIDDGWFEVRSLPGRTGCTPRSTSATTR